VQASALPTVSPCTLKNIQILLLPLSLQVTGHGPGPHSKAPYPPRPASYTSHASSHWGDEAEDDGGELEEELPEAQGDGIYPSAHDNFGSLPARATSAEAWHRQQAPTDAAVRGGGVAGSYASYAVPGLPGRGFLSSANDGLGAGIVGGLSPQSLKDPFHQFPFHPFQPTSFDQGMHTAPPLSLNHGEAPCRCCACEGFACYADE
jgi:hypothetical protein